MRRILARLLALALLATTGGDADTDVGTESDAVNDWGSQCTAGRIPELPPPGFITAQTVLVLTNATYFQADWQTHFGKYGTISSDFTRLDGTTVPDEGRFAKIADRIDQTLLEYLSTIGASRGSYPGISSGPELDAAAHAADIAVDEIAVDEIGTVATAATALGFDESGPPEPELTVVADQPFLCLIRHRDSGLVSFAGQVVDPTA